MTEVVKCAEELEPLRPLSLERPAPKAGPWLTSRNLDFGEGSHRSMGHLADVLSRNCMGRTSETRGCSTHPPILLEIEDAPTSLGTESEFQGCIQRIPWLSYHL